jgi:hypothetical protein
MRFVPIADYPSRFDAEIAAQDLELADIPYIIKSDDLAVGGGGTSLMFAELHVPEDLVAQAIEILEEGLERE